MDVRNIIKRCLVGILMMNISVVILAQSVNRETILLDILLDKEVISESEIHLKRVTNNSDYNIQLDLHKKDNEKFSFYIDKGESKEIDKVGVSVQVHVKNVGEGWTIWSQNNSKEEWNKLHPSEKPSNDTENEENDYENKEDEIQNTPKNINNKAKNGTEKTKIGDKVANAFQQSDKDSSKETESKPKQTVQSSKEGTDSIADSDSSTSGLTEDDNDIEDDNDTLINICAVGLVILIFSYLISIMVKKEKNKRKQTGIQQSSINEVSPAIVVRRKTTSILKKQSLDDVIDNNSYYLIESVDFCEDSAVKRIYIKNACVKDIYNMYAEDLRNPDNPKEDGCMVLGRWIYDEQSNEYNVSLEEIVKPGDDAVFQEYELNFGGKIKLRVAEKLRKLRRDTNLQYDLTCWVHSHPGLGVFFSNSDSSVQMQLKHPSHPNFLIAIVVDILTPQQELGIFTFKRDSTINSRNEIKKMYSLEELHKWAVESERNSYKPEDHYNVLSKAESISDNCQGIQLTNGAVIDISSITTEDRTGLAGWIYGYKTQSRGKNEYVVNTVSNVNSNADNDLLGCLVIGTRCSIPSIRKAIADHSNKINFVMFYSVKDETITTIPITNMELSMDEKYYSEEKINDLKIWTRRKR